MFLHSHCDFRVTILTCSSTYVFLQFSPTLLQGKEPSVHPQIQSTGHLFLHFTLCPIYQQLTQIISELLQNILYHQKPVSVRGRTVSYPLVLSASCLCIYSSIWHNLKALYLLLLLEYIIILYFSVRHGVTPPVEILINIKMVITAKSFEYMN